MRQLFAILICSIGISAYAIDYTAMQMTTPVASMQSVNSSAYMSSGSVYTSEVYAIGANSPSAAPSRPRYAPPGTDDSGHDPNNPQFAPLGDAFIPLLLMVMVYATSVLLRRRKSRV